MLKSVSTQFAATLFFGPLGLAYCSVAAAVFFTLLLAVLYFTGFGMLAVFLMWPVSIVVGLIFAKLHNDGVRSSGSRLLLGPGEEMTLAGTLNSWARAVAVLALIVTAGFFVYAYYPKSDNGPGRIVASQTAEQAPEPATVADAVDSTAAVIPAKSADGNDNVGAIALPQREVATVVLDSNGETTQGSSGSLNSGQPELTVSGAVVNLRRGPGTNFPIVTQVEEGDKLFEFARDGQWINVETESSGFTGWIYSTLVR